MKKKVTMLYLAAKIEWNWFFIMRMRKRANKLISSGIPLTSKKLISLDRKIARRSYAANEAKCRYENLAGITELLQQAR